LNGCGQVATLQRIEQIAREDDPLSLRQPSSTRWSIRRCRSRLGFQLVPWRPALEQHLGKQVGGVMRRATEFQRGMDNESAIIASLAPTSPVFPGSRSFILSH
jgi:hypothetical protein